MLELKFEEGFTEKAIAKQMGVKIRTLHNYWRQLEKLLGIHEEPGKDLKIAIVIKLLLNIQAKLIPINK